MIYFKTIQITFWKQAIH